MPRTRYEIYGELAEIVISNPPLNLWGPQLIADVEDGVARAAAERPRALLFRAEGDVFSAGVDVHVFEGLDASSAADLTERLLRLTHAIEDLPLPTLAVAHGLCLTAGLELSLACDLLWAAEGVQFGLVEKVVGITPLMGGTQRMAERAGSARAREFVMTGRLYEAQTLHAWGVVKPRAARGRAAGEGAAVRRRPRGRPDGRPRRHQGDRARAGGPRDPRRRRAHRGADVTAVRDGRLPERGAIVLAGRTRQGHVHW
jgi:enoyl-CoA hydratase/carnithine racemase